MSTRPRYVQSEVSMWDDTDINEVVEVIRAGKTVSGYLSYPQSYIIRNIADVYDAVDSTGTRVYGGPDDEGSVDGADSAAVINACVTSLADTGGHIHLKRGVYSVESSILLTNAYNIRLSGETYLNYASGYGGTQNGTILRLANGVNDYIIKCVNSTPIKKTSLEIDHLFFDGNAAEQTGGGALQLDYAAYNYVHENAFYDAYGARGFYSAHHIEENIFERNIFVGCGMNIVDLLACQIRGNMIATGGNCHGIYVSGTSGNQGNRIVENDIYGDSGGTTGDGIRVSDLNYSVLSNNYIYSNYGSGVNLYGRCDHNVIANNVIRDNGYGSAGQSGIYIYDLGGAAAKSTRNLITGNNIFDTGTGNQDYGVRIAANCEYNSVYNNVLSGHSSIHVQNLGLYTRTDLDVAAPSSLDLSAAGATLVVYPAAQRDCQLTGYTLFYTEASSADAGVFVEVGRYQDGVALDADYFDIVTTEVSKSLGYSKTYYTGDLGHNLISAGDTVTVTSIGGKTGTGEVLVVLHIAYT